MSMAEQVKGESPTRLYVAAKNMLHRLNRNSNAAEIHHFVDFLTLYPGDLRVAVMKDLRNTYERVIRLCHLTMTCSSIPSLKHKNNFK